MEHSLVSSEFVATASVAGKRRNSMFCKVLHMVVTRPSVHLAQACLYAFIGIAHVR